jgi:hypothetical protein
MLFLFNQWYQCLIKQNSIIESSRGSSDSAAMQSRLELPNLCRIELLKEK